MAIKMKDVECLYDDALSGNYITPSNLKRLKAHLFEDSAYNEEDWNNLIGIASYNDRYINNDKIERAHSSDNTLKD